MTMRDVVEQWFYAKPDLVNKTWWFFVREKHVMLRSRKEDAIIEILYSDPDLFDKIKEHLG